MLGPSAFDRSATESLPTDQALVAGCGDRQEQTFGAGKQRYEAEMPIKIGGSIIDGIHHQRINGVNILVEGGLPAVEPGLVVMFAKRLGDECHASISAPRSHHARAGR